jgi:hypothetical protein
VNQLHAEGFRTSNGTKILKSRVEKVIKNPFYFGVMVRHEKYYLGKHKPLITKTIYDQAQEVLSGTRRPQERGLFFPLRGLLVCAECTCMYTASLKKGHEYYYCTNGKGSCLAHSRYLRSEPATELIADALGAVQFDEEIIAIMYEAAREKYSDSYSYTESIRTRLQGQLEALEKQEVAAFEDSSLGILRRDLYERKMADIKNKRILLQHEINTLRIQDGISTLEPTKQKFDLGNTARNRFLSAKPSQQRVVASEVLWNLSVKDGKTEQVRYRSYFETMAKAPKNGDLLTMLAVWDDIRTEMALWNRYPHH